MPRFFVEVTEIYSVRKTYRYEIEAPSMEAIDEYDDSGEPWEEYPGAKTILLETDEDYEDGELISAYEVDAEGNAVDDEEYEE